MSLFRGSRLLISTTVLLFTAIGSNRATGQTPPTPPPPMQKGGDSEAAPKPSASATYSAPESIRPALATLDEAEREGIDDATRQSVLQRSTAQITAIQKQDPNNPWLPYLYGRQLLLSGRNGDAITQLQRFVQSRTGATEWRAQLLLGDLFVDEFPRLAKPYYERADELNREDPAVLYGLSQCSMRLGDKGKAVEFADRAVRADGRKHVRYLAHLASVLAADGRLSQAKAEALTAFDVAEAAAQKADAQSSAVQTAITQLELLIKVLAAQVRESPGDAARYVELSRRLTQRGELSQMLAIHDALNAIETGIKAVGGAAPPIPLLEQHGICLARLGRIDQAKAQFQAILQRDPLNAVAKEWLDRLTTAPANP